ncbi:hypothetical protein [Luteibacter yeojuensis]|uniref:hypothetical protein n=1 Tax=Luteibacter yeojuensis TaxID=345309 RepID=UPI000A674EE3|nr:hypothetical protein [Luteibacter yeojuensis]
MPLFDVFRKKPPALLTVRVDDSDICTITEAQLPIELTPSAKVRAGSTVVFIASDGTAHAHGLAGKAGWAHFSVRVHASKACQADCVISDSPTFDPAAVMQGKATGIRFQPFFLPGGPVDNASMAGKGLFQRGMHFSGNITPGNILLSCECDACHRAFLIQSYHAGFSHAGYFYSGSGRFTMTVGTQVPGSPAPLSTPEPAALLALEASLPPAPDGTRFAYLNPFRCPHCHAPYIDFEANPGSREQEYYGNYFVGAELLRYDPVSPPM